MLPSWNVCVRYSGCSCNIYSLIFKFIRKVYWVYLTELAFENLNLRATLNIQMDIINSLP
jgi:hypothetical protein